jgi:heptosyltransferase-3
MKLPERPKILVITLRRLGDVLLTTPLVRSIRRGFPDATLDMLVFRGSERILAGNPDVNHVIAIPERPGVVEGLRLIGRLWRRYDLAVTTQSGDRPSFFAVVAGKRRVGPVPFPGNSGAWWKRRVFDPAVELVPNCHRVEDLQRLARALGLDPQADIVCPQGKGADGIAPAVPYAVVHPNPMYPYKRWTDEGWRKLARGLTARGLAVVATEGRDPAERAYNDNVWGAAETPVIRERGQLDWAGLAALLKGASVYVGPDTSITHLAAASGCPTIALYGPTPPKLHAPWPIGGLAEPWADAGTIQERGNVWLVQNPLPCLPCDKLGCEGHLDSYSQCMDELPVERVLIAVDRALASR